MEYDAQADAIEITQGAPYTHAGDELQSLPAGEKEATASPQKLIYNGNEVDVAAYNIDGYNYFRLRDIAMLLDFEVSFDNNTVTLDLDSHCSR